MPNWCYSSYVVHTEHAKKMFAKLEEWTNKNYAENDFGTNWLGNVVEGSEIGDWNEWDCRGTIKLGDCDDNRFDFNTVTAWADVNETLRAVFDKHLCGDYEVEFTSEMDDELESNDPDYIGKYYIDYSGDNDELYLDSPMNCSKDDVRNYAKKLIDTMHIDDVIELMLDIEENLSIKEWRKATF